MKGSIKAYSATVNAGVIAGENGKSYVFQRAEWHGPAIPAPDQKVQFNEAGSKASGVKQA